MQIKAPSCHWKFVVHEVMNYVANLKAHLRDCSGNVNIIICYVYDPAVHLKVKKYLCIVSNDRIYCA